MEQAPHLGGLPLSDVDCVPAPTCLVHIRYVGSLDPAPVKAAGKVAATSTSAAPPTPMARPSRAALEFLYQTLQWRVPTAQVGISRAASGGFDCCVDVGCQDDYALATELSAVCGIAPGAVAMRVSDRIEPSASFCLNAVLIGQVMADPTGYTARVIAGKEVQRCILGVEIDRIWAPATSLGSEASESLGSQEAEPPTLFIRVPPPSAMLSGLSGLAHAKAVVARILTKLPHARLRMMVVEGGEEDLMLVPELCGVGISFAKVVKPPHPPDYPLVCHARMLSMDALDSAAAAVAAECNDSGAAGGAAGPGATPSVELVDEKVQSQHASEGHITVGAYGKLGSDLLSTGHSFSASLRQGMLRIARSEVGFRVDLVAMMNPAQFDGTGAMPFAVCADAEPGAMFNDDLPVKQRSLQDVIADASLFQCRSFSGPVPADALAPMPQLARWVPVVHSTVPALGLPCWSAYCGEVEIWGVHGKDASGAVHVRLADVVGYSTKMLPERTVSGEIVRASTVVYIAKMRGAVVGGPSPLCPGHSGGVVTQKRAGADRRLHSLVAVRAWHSTDGGVSKTWYVLLVPIHFVVAQIAQLLREQSEGAVRTSASEAGGGASSDRAPTSIVMGLQLQSSMWSDAEPLLEPAAAAVGGGGCASSASA